jgi:Uncharacterized protein conserved in bacteria (DUF2188)
MSKKNIHVTRRADGSWAVIGEGDARASSLHDTQHDATEEARQLAMKQESELVIHDRYNRIRDKDSFGPDPDPPHDRKH